MLVLDTSRLEELQTGIGTSNSTVKKKLNNKNTKAYKGRCVIKGVVEITRVNLC